MSAAAACVLLLLLYLHRRDEALIEQRSDLHEELRVVRHQVLDLTERRVLAAHARQPQALSIDETNNAGARA